MKLGSIGYIHCELVFYHFSFNIYDICCFYHSDGYNHNYHVAPTAENHEHDNEEYTRISETRVTWNVSKID